MLDIIRAIWQGNPVRVTAIAAGIIVAALAKAGIVVDQANIIEALTLALPVVLGGELARTKTTPYTGTAATPSDVLLDEALTSQRNPNP